MYCNGAVHTKGDKILPGISSHTPTCHFKLFLLVFQMGLIAFTIHKKFILLKFATIFLIAQMLQMKQNVKVRMDEPMPVFRHVFNRQC